ncbi:hypothetical protein OPKNFCMD_3255 [Methylobacterium crusticola]|uniref:Uncharacterized protein n=1 Tax=Methylobacterium crusticola TaxID=1697972 RepID=A0ABQ4R156_9HYPH|nr:hypothetical protein OPKNFCMD_3255 [Methylobacterium crusticola]
MVKPATKSLSLQFSFLNSYKRQISSFPLPMSSFFQR